MCGKRQQEVRRDRDVGVVVDVDVDVTGRCTGT